MVNVQCSMVNGQCSMVNGQCSMVNVQWSMFNGQWSMVNVQWSMFNGQWLMVNVQWSMVNVKTVPFPYTRSFPVRSVPPSVPQSLCEYTAEPTLIVRPSARRRLSADCAEKFSGRSGDNLWTEQEPGRPRVQGSASKNYQYFTPLGTWGTCR